MVERITELRPPRNEKEIPSWVRQRGQASGKEVTITRDKIYGRVLSVETTGLGENEWWLASSLGWWSRIVMTLGQMRKAGEINGFDFGVPLDRNATGSEETPPQAKRTNENLVAIFVTSPSPKRDKVRESFESRLKGTRRNWFQSWFS